jgi:hypothetical protein
MSKPDKPIRDNVKELPSDQRKVYEKPAIIHEQILEARAGSPVPGSIDMFEMDSQE